MVRSLGHAPQSNHGIKETEVAQLEAIRQQEGDDEDAFVFFTRPNLRTIINRLIELDRGD